MSIDIESQISLELSTVPNSIKVRGAVDQYRSKKKSLCSSGKRKMENGDGFLPASLALMQKHEILAKLNRNQDSLLVSKPIHILISPNLSTRCP